MLKLEKPIELSLEEPRNCVDLPKHSMSPFEGNVTVACWRLFSNRIDQEFLSKYLRTVDLEIVDDEICVKLYHGFVTPGVSQFVPDTMICVGSKEGHKGSCPGDSGGPQGGLQNRTFWLILIFLIKFYNY